MKNIRGTLNETLGNVTSIEDTIFIVNYFTSFNQKIIYCVISGLGCLGNIFVVYVFLKSDKLRGKISNMLIINQSMIDMFASLFIFLSKMLDGMDWPWITEPGPTVTVFCVVWLSEYIPWACMVVSTFNLVALTIERYIALIYPMVYVRYISKKRICLFIPSVWFIGFAHETYAIASSTMNGRNCSLWTKWPNKISQRVFGVYIFVIEYFIPICIFLFCYTRIVVMIHMQAKIQVGSTQRERQMTRSRIIVIRTLIIVSVGFFLCWTWDWIYALLYYIGVVNTFTGLQYQIGAFAVYISCCINPFIYSFVHTDFQNAMKSVFSLSTTLRLASLCRCSKEPKNSAATEMSDTARDSKAMTLELYDIFKKHGSYHVEKQQQGYKNVEIASSECNNVTLNRY